MLFSEAKWDDAREINRYIPVSGALSFESVESSLLDAEQLFLRPLLGQEMTDRVQSLYDSTEELEFVDKQVLDECKRAVANLAFWYNFTELNVRITDAGFQRQENAESSFKQLFKYQEDKLRESFKNKGFNALDRILYLLEHYLDRYPEYLTSAAYEDRRKAIVKSAHEFNERIFINASRVLFLRMKPIIKQIEETQLPSLIGTSLYTDFRAALDNGEENILDVKTEMLRGMICSWVCYKAAADLIRLTGSITDRGLYFVNLDKGDGNLAAEPARQERAEDEARRYDKFADHIAQVLMGYVRDNLPFYYKGGPQTAYNRDNNNHSTFFA